MREGRANNLLLLNTLRFLKRVIPPALKVRAAITIIAVIVNSLVDLLGLASLIPLFMVIIDEDKIKNSEVLQWLFHKLNFSSNNTFILFLCSVVVVLMIAKNLFSLFLSSIQFRFSFSLYRYFALNLYKNYYDRGLLFLKDQNANRLVNNINSICLLFSQNVVVAALGVINELFIVMFVMTGIMWYDPRTVLLLVVVILPAFFLFFRFMRTKTGILGKQINQTAVLQNKTLYESFYGYVDVQIKNKASWLQEKYKDLLSKMSGLQIKNQVYLLMPLKVIEIAVIISLVLIIAVNIYFGENLSGLSMLLGVFGIAAYRVLPSINRIMVFLMNIKNHQHTLEVIEQAVTATYGQKHADDSARMRFVDKIVLQNLHFSFNGTHQVLNDISLCINKGEKLGIIGKSGSGKSTLLNLLLGFYTPQQGAIYVDNVQLTEQNIYQWRNIIGYVPQEVFIMDATLAENIAFCEDGKDIDFERLNRVIELASLKPFVDSLPMGVNTFIGERGSRLSGGQKQRIGIARALYNDAEILFLDEATSSLDTATELEITSSIKYLSEKNKSLTIIIIAHRITTLKHCDRIVEFEAGRIIGEHSYEALQMRE
jgi:ABC-type bacteriocin/lantibiotic exporters, contain an N-terminal double-glycine peptidase domain